MNVPTSSTVRNGCAWCGGGKDGFMRYEADHRHADWCPRVNDDFASILCPLAEATQGISVEDIARAKQLRGAGHTWGAIANELGHSTNGLRQAVLRTLPFEAAS